MTVYKLSLKVMNSNLGPMLLFLGIFIGISLLAAGSGVTPAEQVFSRSRVPIAFIAEESSPLIEGLRVEIEKIADIKPYEDDPETLLEAMFFDRISYIVRIPVGFTRNFLAGEESAVIAHAGQSEGRSMYVDLAVGNFLNTLRLYRDFTPEMALEEMIGHVHRDLGQKSAVRILAETAGENLAADPKRSYFNYLIFFNYQAYSLFAILILGISTNLLVFNSRMIRMRQACSPVSSRKQSLQLFLANFAYALFCWLIVNAVSLGFIPELFGTGRMYLFMANSFLLCFWASCISFFIAHLTKSRNAINAITNVVALGSSFLAGVFVPQYLLGSAVLRAASFTPTYWFVLANTQIAGESGSSSGLFSLASRKELLSSFGIQFMFGLAFLAAALVLRKKRALEAA